MKLCMLLWNFCWCLSRFYLISTVEILWYRWWQNDSWFRMCHTSFLLYSSAFFGFSFFFFYFCKLTITVQILQIMRSNRKYFYLVMHFSLLHHVRRFYFFLCCRWGFKKLYSKTEFNVSQTHNFKIKWTIY